MVAAVIEAVSVEAVGKTFVRGDSQTGKKGHIIGVIKDFNFTKLDQPVYLSAISTEASERMYR